MENIDRVWVLIARSLSREATKEEREELLTYLSLHPEMEQQFNMLKRLWNKTAGEDEESELGSSTRINRILRKAEQERQEERPDSQKAVPPSQTFFKRIRVKLAYAAVLATAFIAYNYSKPIPKVSFDAQKQVVAVQNGSRTKMLLPDGSTVWLNGDSRLYYDDSFSGPVREVRLEGEAYFDVAKDAKRPFIVRVGDVNIKVLGTAFNVKCYEGDKNVETTLIRGKIEVSENSKKSKPHIFLEPNQKLIIPVETVQLNVVEEKSYKILSLDKELKEEEHVETAWLYNRVEFRGENFEELGRKLERWYNVKIEFEDDAVKRLKFNGSFEKETVREAFSALQKVASFSYKIEGHEIYVKSSE